MTLGGRVRVAGVVVASNVRLGRAARASRFFCNFVTSPSALPLCRGFTSPFLDPALLTAVVPTPGTDDLTIPPHTGTAAYAAGSWRDISVGTGALLQLAGGSYAARSIRIARAGRILCAAACRLTVVGDVMLRRGAELGAVSPQRADTVRIDVAGSGVATAFSTRRRARVSATVYAPDGAIVLGTLGSYRGAYVGRTVTIGPARQKRYTATRTASPSTLTS